MSCILGLDISTHIVGWSIIDYVNLNLLLFGYIDIGKKKDFAKVSEVKNRLLEIKNLYSIKGVAIEDILSKFSSRKSNIKTIITLAKFNALVTYECFNIFETEPFHINVIHARRVAHGSKLPKSSSIKDYMFNFINNLYSLNLENKKENQDITDSIVVGRCLILDERSQ